LVHNLVVAHSTCNSHKSDLLAAEPYLERWAGWVRDRDSDLIDIGTNAGLVIDCDCSRKVAEWSYEHAARLGAEVWLGGREYGHLGESWRTVFLRNGPSPA
ncbi:MAG TPA: hypothetical protein VLT59_05895, partial [Steroidobacteraceae bacterium]|nr:hypothetical protein [Steroidobacteraceae bacterium]